VDIEFGAHDVCRPDIAGWRRDNVPAFPVELPIRYRPDWLCEALSPGTARRDQGDKRALYQRPGVPWYWQLDPANRTLTVLRLVREGYVVELAAGDSGKLALPPFDAVELDLSAVFSPIP
jgi:Uma2 family endonuclease